MPNPDKVRTASETSLSTENGNGSSGRAIEIFSDVTFSGSCDRVDDLQWSEEAEARGEFAPYVGRKVAVLHRTVVGVGDNGLALRDAVCQQHHVPPSRPVIAYVEGETE